MRQALACSAFLAVLTCGSLPCHGAAYSITDLGTIGGGGAYSGAEGINAAGLVTGYSDTTPAPNLAGHAFLYDGTMNDLGTLGGPTSGGLDINAAGHVVGRSDISMTDPNLQVAFFYDATMHSLGSLGGTYALAFALNDSDLVVGISATLGDAAAHAFYYDTSMHDLGTFGGQYSSALDVNNSGKMTGSAMNSMGINRVFLYDGTMHDLGAPFGSIGGEGAAINANDWVAGYVGEGAVTNSFTRPFLYDGAMHDLGSLRYPESDKRYYSAAGGLNNRGHVVGTSESAALQLHALFYSHATGLVDLNTLIDPSSGWELLSALDINDAGQIVGQGIIGGVYHAYLLTPAPDATPVGPLSGLPAVPPGAATGWLGQTLSAASFYGATLNGGTAVGPTNFVVGAGAEFASFGESGFVSVDVFNRRIEITALANQTLTSINTIRIGNVNGTIGRILNMSLNPATNWTGFSPIHVTCDDNFVTINLSGLSGVTGQKVVIDVQMIPEPSSLALVAVGGTALIRRRRLRASGRRT